MNTSQNPFGDKRTALAFFLSLIVIISYTELYLKPPTEQGVLGAGGNRGVSPQIAQQAVPTGKVAPSGELANPFSAQVVAKESAQAVPLPVSGVTAASHPTTLPVSEMRPEDSPRIIVSTGDFEAELLLLGGVLSHFRLKDHTKELGGKELLDLVALHDATPSPFGVELLGGSDRGVLFSEPVITPSSVRREGDVITLEPGQELQIVLQSEIGEGKIYKKTFRFREGSYFVEADAEFSAPPVGALPMKLGWTTFVPEFVAQNSYDPVSFSFLYPNDKVEHINITTLEKDSGRKETLAQWGTLGDKYFMAAMVAPSENQSMIAQRQGDHYGLFVVGDASRVSAKVFLGPKNYSHLKKLAFRDLHRSVDLGFFSFLAIPLLTVIQQCYLLLGNYGLAIILLTLLLKFAFLPLTQASLKSMKAMQDLQPEIKALRERIKDANQLNQEMFALYKRKGVNPMGGCLPMLIQIPVFLGLYNALLNATELRHSPFALWITDLSAPEALYVLGIPIPVMIILMGLSMFFQQWLMPSNMDEQQRKVMLLMPVVFTVMFIIFPFPSGLVLYWLINNLISIVQQVYLRRESGMSPFMATVVASFGIFLVGFLLTQIH